MLLSFSPRFWECYGKLPTEVQRLARKNYQLWREKVAHPSLRFKPVENQRWSVRIGLNYRAIGRFVRPDIFIWDWIDPHAEYDQILRRKEVISYLNFKRL